MQGDDPDLTEVFDILEKHGMDIDEDRYIIEDEE
jgi:hypothetical protein